MRVLFLENEDSFSWNVIDCLPWNREEVRVVEGTNESEVHRALPEAEVLVIGPGPRDPIRCGFLVDVVRIAARRRLPTLGVCLGHQAIGLAFGASLTRAEPSHGKRSLVRFEPARLLPGIHGEHMVMRYHSLALDGVASPLRAVARTADGVVMALEHESLPILGMQFHPDSFATPDGREMLSAFAGALA